MKPMFLAALLALVTVCAAQPALAQKDPVADPLIATVESMKHSVARLLCYSRLQSPTPTSLGSAFFISSSGTFLTAAHVFSQISEQPDFCRFAAVAVPVDAWDPELREEFHTWFPFRPADCKIDNELDVARCRTIDNVSILRTDMTFAVRPAQIEWNSPPDGSEVGIIGFPLGVRDPMTSRAVVSTSRIVWNEGKRSPELLLDRPSLPGSSGSPVFLSDGRVVGIVVGNGTGDITGLTLARPGASFRKLLDDAKK